MKLGEWFIEIVAKGAEAAKGAVDVVADAWRGLAGAEAKSQSATEANAKALVDTAKVLSTVSDRLKMHMTLFGGMAETSKKATASVTSFATVGKSAIGGFAEKFGDVNKGWGTMEERAKQAGSGIASAMKYASASIIAFTTAGLAGTYEGERLGYQFQQLSREIAAVFLPVITSLTTGIGRLVTWFRSLSGSQQDVIERWGVAVVAGTAVAVVLGKLGILAPLVTLSFKALGASMSAAAFNPIVGSIMAVVGAVGALVAILGVGSKRAADLAKNMQAIKENGLTDKQMKESQAVQHVEQNRDNFKGKSKEEQLALLRESKDYAQSEVDRQGQDAKSLWALPGGGAARKKAEYMQAEVVALEKMISQLENGGKIDTSKLKLGSKQDDDSKRSMTPKVGGFEAISSTYARIQEAAIQKYDPQKAADDAAAAAAAQLEAQQETNRILRDQQNGMRP